MSSARLTFASSKDYEVCRLIHRKYGKSYYMASRLFPKEIRMGVDALYGFVRIPDNMVDSDADLSTVQLFEKMWAWKNELKEGLKGVKPTHAVMRAFCDTIDKFEIPSEEPFIFLDAMNQDRYVTSYESWASLQGYMRGSATSVGYMMCHIMHSELNEFILDRSRCLSEAMQLTNFLRDVAEDIALGRVYLPREDLDLYGVSVEQIKRGEVDSGFIDLMKFEIARCRELYLAADEGIVHLDRKVGIPVMAGRLLYSSILDKIEEQGYDVFKKRAALSKPEKIALASTAASRFDHTRRLHC